jgi:hypothetical protein
VTGCSEKSIDVSLGVHVYMYITCKHIRRHVELEVEQRLSERFRFTMTHSLAKQYQA